MNPFKNVKTAQDLQSEQEAKARKHKIDLFTQAITNHIQSKINEYNSANGLAFSSIDSVYKYTSEPTYSHYDWCVALVAWNIQVWEAARAIQLDVLNGVRPEPTVAELVAELPVWNPPA